MNEPEPVDERPEPEIRGGNRREDYTPSVYPVSDEVFEELWGPDDEPPGGNDPETQ